MREWFLLERLFAEAGQPSLVGDGSSSIMGRDVSVAWHAEDMLLIPRGGEGPPSSPSLLTQALAMLPAPCSCSSSGVEELCPHSHCPITRLCWKATGLLGSSEGAALVIF